MRELRALIRLFDNELFPVDVELDLRSDAQADLLGERSRDAKREAVAPFQDRLWRHGGVTWAVQCIAIVYTR